MNLIFVWIVMDFELNGINKNCFDVAFAIGNRFSSKKPPNQSINIKLPIYFNWIDTTMIPIEIGCLSIVSNAPKPAACITKFESNTRVWGSKCSTKPTSEQQHHHHHHKRWLYCEWNSNQTGRISIEHWTWFLCL